APAAGAAGASPVEAGAGIETVQLSDDGARILVPLAGRLFVIERATGASRELAIAPFRDAQLSPDGKRVGFARSGDLWVATVGEACAGGADGVGVARRRPRRAARGAGRRGPTGAGACVGGGGARGARAPRGGGAARRARRERAPAGLNIVAWRAGPLSLLRCH